MEYFFPKEVFDSIRILCDALKEREFGLVEGFHFNFFNTHPFAKFPEMKCKFWNEKTDEVVVYSINKDGETKVIAKYNQGEL